MCTVYVIKYVALTNWAGSPQKIISYLNGKTPMLNSRGEQKTQGLTLPLWHCGNDKD